MTRSAFVAVVGRPNVGKSTIVNALVGDKVVITSSRPQTTRNTVRGVLTRGDLQLVFIDTPGLHRPRTVLGERLNRLVYGTLDETDGALLVLDASQRIGPGDRLIAERLREAGVPVVVAVNKVDKASRDQVVEQLGEAGEWDFTAYVPVSALRGEGLAPIVSEFDGLAAEGPFFFPEDAKSDQTDEHLVAELIREKFLERLRDELPHSLAVVVDELETRESGLLFAGASVYVEKASHKGMVIGKGGALLRTVGTEAREELERLFGTQVYVELRVKVEKDWQRRDHALDRLGF
jgi:GTPase